MIRTIACFVLVAFGLYPFGMAVWVLISAENFSPEFVTTYLITGIGFFILAIAVDSLSSRWISFPRRALK